MTSTFWFNKSVFLTGHTGFKGGWIAHWLSKLGAKVHGFALDPSTTPNFYDLTYLHERLASSTMGDIRDLKALEKAMQKAKPDIIIHMAAQPLVLESYRNPVETFATNIMGTINVLEASRWVNSARVIINVTTDKCYENKEWLWSYRENDSLGGRDPYSASKTCADYVAAAYSNSFLDKVGIHLATVRAGNVIGGGDWASDRLIPDFFRAAYSGNVLKIRSLNSTRPWQHVLEPLSGYLILAEALYKKGADYVGAWNFGSNSIDAKSVQDILKQLCESNLKVNWSYEKSDVHEATLLKLDSSKAKVNLGWRPRWSLDTALKKAIEWYMASYEKRNMVEVTDAQINCYENT